MEHEEAALLLGAYAAHALDDDEYRKVTSHLAACGRCLAEVRRYEYVLGLLGFPGARRRPA